MLQWRLWQAALIVVAIVFHASLSGSAQVQPLTANKLSVAIERTRSVALLYSCLLCFSDTDEITASTIRKINLSFDPRAHMNEYKNWKDVELLLDYVRQIGGQEYKNNDIFTNSPKHISQFSLILNVLYANAENWQLFYNTSVWLADKVNTAQLFWALMVVLGEKYSDTVISPTMMEVLPQYFINKREVARIAGIQVTDSGSENHPLHYYMSDPGLNEFHTNWHIDNPFWWDDKKYGVIRDRKGELFFYMHHQIIARINAELLSNGLPDLIPAEVDLNYVIPEGAFPDVINLNYLQFPIRRDGVRLRSLDDGKLFKEIKSWYDRLNAGIDQQFFLKKDGTRVSLQFPNGTDIVGATVEPSTEHSVDLDFYGVFHNFFHRFEAGDALALPVPGLMMHPETSMRDPAFYRLHKMVDAFYTKQKLHAKPYTKIDLDYPGVQVGSVGIQLMPSQSSGFERIKPRWPPMLSTYFDFDTYDIFAAARPCRGIGEKPAIIRAKSLKHVPFNYTISIRSTRNLMSHGMVRIFLLPEFSFDGRKLEIEESHGNAIELDRFRIKIEPNKEAVISRSSKSSSVTKEEPTPGIKTLFSLTNATANDLFKSKLNRACGYPHNLLLPKGTKKGLLFRLVVIVSQEPQPSKGSEYPNYPYCGALNGVPFPDERAMGFPFDRKGTRFMSYQNVKQIPVLIRHQEN